MNTITTAPEYKIQIDTEKILTELNNGFIPQMKAENTIDGGEIATQSHAMDSIPIDTFNSLVEHLIRTGKLRDAMLLVCAGNWGMRYSDTVRVRFCHLFDADGKIKQLFHIPSGEKKTGKDNVYFNNKATEFIIRLYLKENPRVTRLDYLFTNNSNNCATRSLLDIEIEERFGKFTEAFEDKSNSLDKQFDGLLDLYSKSLITEETFIQKQSRIVNDKEVLQKQMDDLSEKINQYKNENQDKHFRRIRKPISRTAVEKLIKGTLAEIGVIPQNRADKSQTVTVAEKYNTHSLRKSFAEYFGIVGRKLRKEGILEIDNEVMELLQVKFMHSDITITNRYNKTTLRAFEIICNNMNLGMEAICNAIGG